MRACHIRSASKSTRAPANMSASWSPCLCKVLLLTTFLPFIHAITLAQFQPINGFSQACVNAYNTPLSGCTASDLEQGSCSTTCIAFLEALTKILHAECGGTSAYPNTLIGSFFKNEGTGMLCPNIMGPSDGSNAVATTEVGQVSTYTLGAYTPTSTYTPLSFTTATLPLLSAAPTSSTTYTSQVEHTKSSASSSAAATTTQFAIVNTTVAPNTSIPTASSSSTDRSRTQASQTSTSSRSTATGTSGGGDNGGGSPLDVGSTSSSNRSARREAWVLGLMVGSTGLVLAL